MGWRGGQWTLSRLDSGLLMNENGYVAVWNDNILYLVAMV